jgi:hypothetical protein
MVLLTVRCQGILSAVLSCGEVFSVRDRWCAASVNFSGMEEHRLQRASMIDVPFSRVNPRIGIIGTGRRGTRLLRDLLANDGQVVAVCDVVQEHAA